MKLRSGDCYYEIFRIYNFPQDRIIQFIEYFAKGKLIDDIDKRDFMGRTLLYEVFYAFYDFTRHSFVDEISSLVKSLIENRANASINVGDYYGNTPLHLAVGRWSKTIIQVIDYLVQKGADINQGNVKGRTPFHMAVLVGKTPVVKYFIQNGAAINQADGEGNTALHLAAAYGHTFILDIG